MNFAEQLINWRTNNSPLQNCEKRIKDQINAKTSFIIRQLKTQTVEGDIGIYVFDTTEFFKTLVDLATYYDKTCYTSSLELLFINECSLENDITVIKDLMNKNCFYIFFNNGATSETASIRLMKTWFNTYVLKDFEKKYKVSNNTTVRFTSFFEIEYNYLPIIKILDKLNIPLAQFNPTELAKENGLSIEKTTDSGFMLRI